MQRRSETNWQTLAEQAMTNGLVVYPIERRVDGRIWIDCLDWDDESGGTEATVHRFEVSLTTGPTHLLVCARCGMHLHADFDELLA